VVNGILETASERKTGGERLTIETKKSERHHKENAEEGKERTDAKKKKTSLVGANRYRIQKTG